MTKSTPLEIITIGSDKSEVILKSSRIPGLNLNLLETSKVSMSSFRLFNLNTKFITYFLLKYFHRVFRESIFNQNFLLFSHQENFLTPKLFILQNPKICHLKCLRFILNIGNLNWGFWISNSKYQLALAVFW
jgi:hypothetical protein